MGAGGAGGGVRGPGGSKFALLVCFALNEFLSTVLSDDSPPCASPEGRFFPFAAAPALWRWEPRTFLLLV